MACLWQVVIKRKLLTRELPIASVDSVLRNLLESGALGPGARSVFCNVIGADEQRMLGVCLISRDGRAVGTSDIPVGVLPNMHRKLTSCQYVVATGDVVCSARHNKKMGAEAGDGGEAMGGDMFINTIRHGAAATLGDCPALLELDPDLKRAVGEDAKLFPMYQTEESLAALPAARRLATKAQRAALRTVGPNMPGGTGDFMAMVMDWFGSKDGVYLGAPVHCDGHVVGTVCGFFNGFPPEGPPAEVRDVLNRFAERMGGVLETI